MPGREGAQASLEYIITLCAALAFILASIGFFGELKEGALFALDVQNAKGFAQRLDAQARTLALLGDGSQSAIEAQIIGEWKIHNGPQGGRIIVTAPSGKTAAIALPPEIANAPEKALRKKISATLEKAGTAILWRE